MAWVAGGRRWGLAFVLLAVLALARDVQAGPADDMRALWVVRTALNSEASVRAMVAAARAGGFTTLFVQIRGRGDAYYASRHEPRARSLAGAGAAFDPLAAVLREARGAGLAVHAWINVGLVADVSALPDDRSHLVRRHPDWLMLPRDLAPALSKMSPKDPRYLARLVAWTRTKSSTVEGLFASPSHERAVEHLLDVVDDIAERYAVAGIHLDYIRYPGAEFDYSRTALDAFAAELTRAMTKTTRRALRRQARHNPLLYTELYPSAWHEYRRARTTGLLRRLRARALARRPGLQFSAAVLPDVGVARESRGQDWVAWTAQRLLDFVCPMVYTTDPETFQRQVERSVAASAPVPVVAGVGAYRLPRDQTLKHIDLARVAGASGFALFSYDALIVPARGADYLGELGRAAIVRWPETRAP